MCPPVNQLLVPIRRASNQFALNSLDFKFNKKLDNLLCVSLLSLLSLTLLPFPSHLLLLLEDLLLTTGSFIFPLSVNRTPI